MKFIFIAAFLLLSSVSFAQQSQNNMVSLDGEWKFRTDPYARGETSSWYAPEFNDSGWDSMTVPGNWDLKNEYTSYAGNAWYRRTIEGNPQWKNKIIRLVFDGVHFETKVWVNGKLAGTNNIGYLPFELDVTKLWNTSGPNSVVVWCNNTYRLGAVWNWGGIRRPVRLIATDKLYISGQFISSSVDLEKKTAEVAIKLLCSNFGTTTEKMNGEVLLSAANGFKRRLPFSVDVAGGETKETFVRTVLTNNDLHLWNCDDPFLYRSEVSLLNGTNIIDVHKERFGIRKIELDNANYSFKLNGESVRMMGFNLVADDRTTGNTLPGWRIKEDVDLMKSLGANMARLTHLPMPDSMFDYLDEKGILVFPEIPLWGFHQLVDKNNPVAKEWLKRMVDNYYNHPSIIGWSVGNEIGHKPGVMEYVEDAIKFVKSIDTTRLGVMVSHTATRKPDPIQYSDLGLVNRYGPAIGSLADKIHQLHPEKILFYSEFGYNQMTEDLDADMDARGMIDSIRFKPYLIGGALWTFNDYRSSFIGTKEFSQNRPWGIVDVFRQKKKAWYSLRREYAPVRELKISKIDSTKNLSATITIVPRKALDLPAYRLKNYVLLWKAINDSSKVIEGGFILLPEIIPGSKDIWQTINFKNLPEISQLKIELLSPGNYSVIDTTVHFKTPSAPEIVYASGIRTRQNDTSTNSGAIRVIFNRKNDQTYYKLKYGLNDLSQETTPTLRNHIDIGKLPFNQSYQVALVAMNHKGEGEVGETKKILIGTEYAPPLIYYTEPADKGFFVGYTTENDDYVFKVQYTTAKGDYSKAKVIQASTKGVMYVPGLDNGKEYYFRMCRIKDNNYQTGWSEEHRVVPDGQQLPVMPLLQGVIRNKNEAILVFEPVKKAIGYTIQYRAKGSGEWTTVKINAAQINHVRISGIKKNINEFRMSSTNAYGVSGYTETVYK
jgi:beta-galactosidase